MKLKVKDMVLVGLFAALTAVLSQISIPIPFTTVPLTMQIFAVALVGIILGAKNGFISMIIYLLLGSIGMPVFAELSGGIGILLGPTGGFLLGYPFMAFIIGFVSQRYHYKVYIFIGMILGLVVDYLMGTIIFSLAMRTSIYESLLMCVLPFILLDMIKIILATSVGITINKRIQVGVR